MVNENKSLDEMSKEDKKDLLRRLSGELGVPAGTLEDVSVQGEVTLRVLDDDGNEKNVETEKFKY